MPKHSVNETTDTKRPEFRQHAILIIIGIPSPTHSFTLGLNPSFSANPPYRSLSFFLLQVSLYGFPRLFTVTSEHIRLFIF